VQTKNGQIMTELTVLEILPKKENVCTTCVHFIELEESYFCELLGAFLSEKILDIPCEFKEHTE
jgi:hypothetical protein